MVNMKTKELKQWLRDNSSGVYRPASEAADYIEELENVIVEIVNIGNSKIPQDVIEMMQECKALILDGK
jgi:hypothetical protein